MNNSQNSGGTMASAVCTVLFVIVTFLYFYSFQGDILGMTQYSWSEHQTYYDRLTGGVIFTVVAFLIYLLTSAVFTFHQRYRALAYLPACVLSGLVTGGDVDTSGSVSISWWQIGITVVILTLFPFIVKRLNYYASFANSYRGGNQSATLWRSNVLILLLSVIIMYGIGNTDRSLHTRLAVERLCHEGRYAEALAYGIPQYDHDSALTMWRAYALSRQTTSDGMTNMGESLFKYNISANLTTLLPRTDGEPRPLLRDCYPVWQSIGFVPRDIDENSERYLQRELRRGTIRKPGIDYLLCTELVNKDLRSFVELIPKYYSGKTELPQHYAEALTIYRLSHKTDPQTAALDTLKVSEAVRADYNDFLALLRSKKSMKAKQADIRDNYFGTYWYYYFKK